MGQYNARHGGSLHILLFRQFQTKMRHCYLYNRYLNVCVLLDKLEKIVTIC